jgi:hypothetical protein
MKKFIKTLKILNIICLILSSGFFVLTLITLNPIMAILSLVFVGVTILGLVLIVVLMKPKLMDDNPDLTEMPKNWDGIFDTQAKIDGANYHSLKEWLKKYYDSPNPKDFLTK